MSKRVEHLIHISRHLSDTAYQRLRTDLEAEPNWKRWGERRLALFVSKYRNERGYDAEKENAS